MVAETATSSSPSHEASDLEKYLKESTESQQSQPNGQPVNAASSSRADRPTTPLDTPTASSARGDTSGGTSLNRTSSIYSFSRNSFSNQLSQLTSVDLPRPESLAESIDGHDVASAAVNALSTAANKIMKWVGKAGEVLTGLDADDDVEWAAAGGRQGLNDVDAAVSTFEGLVEMYVRMVDRVQLRDDIAMVGTEGLQNTVNEMEGILTSWSQVKAQLRGVKEQVELAMEWEELWATVLGDVGLEIDNLERLIFEMEENRHRTMMYDAENESGSHGLDINELENIVEDSPRDEHPRVAGLSAATSFIKPQSPSPPQSRSNHDDSMLLGLIARMQPLRASLDFLPMRLSLFQSRAERVFPTACEELIDRRNRLEKAYKKIEFDAEALRRELSEDKWIIVFRNAGRQAQKMCDSVERSIVKLQEALDSPNNEPGMASTPTLTQKIENFEAKKIHYTPAIDRVLGIMQKGISDRLTVNGEIIRLHSDLNERSHAIQGKTKAMEFLLTQLNSIRSQQQQQEQHQHQHQHHQQARFRDSVSSLHSMDSIARPRTGTPDSSPASSVIITSNSNAHTPHHAANKLNSARDVSSASSTGIATSRRSSVKPLSSVSTSKRLSGIPRATGLLSPTSTSSFASSASTPPRFAPSPASSPFVAQNSSCRRTYSRSVTPVPPVPPLPQKPRWNSSSNTNDLDVGHHYAPTSPSPAYRRDISRNSSASRSSSNSRLPRYLANETSGRRTPSLPPRSSMISRNAAASPSPSTSSPPAIRPSNSRLGHYQSHRLGLSNFPPSPASGGTPFDTGSIPESPTSSSLLHPLPYPKRRDHHTHPASSTSSRSTSIPPSTTKSSISSASHPSPAKRPTTATGSHHYYGSRPSTSMEQHGNRRQSVLSPPRVKSGRQSSMGLPPRIDQRPPWR